VFLHSWNEIVEYYFREICASECSIYYWKFRSEVTLRWFKLMHKESVQMWEEALHNETHLCVHSIFDKL
jgi:hypothetical protein